MLPSPQSCTAWVYHVYHSCPSEHRALVIKPRGAEHSHPLPVPGEDSRHFCPLHLGTGVASENPTQSGTGWNNALLTQRRGKARPATGRYISPLWLAGPSSFLWSWHRAVTYMYPSLAAEGPQPESWWCAWGALMYMFKQSKGTLVEQKQTDIAIQGVKPGTSRMGSLLPIPGLRPIPVQLSGGWKYCMCGLPFPAVLYWNSLVMCLSSH